MWGFWLHIFGTLQPETISTLQFLPILHRAAGVGDANGTADHVGDRKNFKNLVGGDAKIVAFAEVIFNAIIAAQYHGGHEAEHFFGTHIECTFLISLIVEAPKSFDDFVVVRQNAIVHAGAVIIEFSNERHG